MWALSRELLNNIHTRRLCTKSRIPDRLAAARLRRRRLSTATGGVEPSRRGVLTISPLFLMIFSLFLLSLSFHLLWLAVSSVAGFRPPHHHPSLNPPLLTPPPLLFFHAKHSTDFFFLCFILLFFSSFMSHILVCAQYYAWNILFHSSCELFVLYKEKKKNFIKKQDVYHISEKLVTVMQWWY